MAETSRERLIRLLGMIAYLETHGSTEFSVLAEHFGVPVARIEKDLWSLTTSGVPPYLPDECIEFDFDALDEGVATLVEAQGVSQVRLSGREAAALVGALATLIGAGTAPPGAEGVLARIKDAYGQDVPVAVIERRTDAVPEVRAALDEAIAQRRSATLEYTDAADRRTTRVIEPHRLVAIDGIGYVECFCLKANDYRTLRLDRVGSATVGDVMVTHPPTTEHGFTLTAQYEAVVVARRHTRWAFEDIAAADIVDSGDNVTVTFGVADSAWVAGRLLSIAPHLVAVEPAELREAVRRHAAAVSAVHSD